MANFKIYRRCLKRRRSQIGIEYRHGNRKWRLTTGISVLLKDWDNNSRRVLCSDSDHQYKNELIDTKLNNLRRIVIELESRNIDPIISEVKRSYDKKRQIKRDPLKIFLDWITYLQKIGKGEPYLRMVKAVYKTLEKYSSVHGKYNIYEINMQFIEMYVYSMNNGMLTKKPLSNSTVHGYTSMLKKFMEWAESKGHHNARDYISFTNYTNSVATVSPGVKPALTKEQVLLIDKIVEEDFDNYINKYNAENEVRLRLKYKTFEYCRKVFLFLTQIPLRVGDLDNLGYEDSINELGGGISVKLITEKRKKPVFLPLSDIAMRCIVNKSGEGLFFPGKPVDNTLRNYITHICRLIGMTENYTVSAVYGKKIVKETKPICEFIGTHSGRYTFASLWEQNNLDMEELRKILGHSSTEMTQKYVRTIYTSVDTKSLRRSINSIYSTKTALSV